MACERVSRWFAMGFRCSEDGKPDSALPLSSCENDWQRADMRAGYAEGTRGQAHIQFWMVNGPYRHEEIEGKIFAEGNEGDRQ